MRSNGRLSVLLLLVAPAALAGCVDLGSNLTPDALVTPGTAASVVHGFDGAVLDPATALPAGLPLPAGVQRFTGARSFEPTLGVTSTGALFMTADRPQGVFPPPTVMRSRDQGLTWEDAGPTLPAGQDNPPLSNDPFTYVDEATDRLFMIDLIGTACSWLSWSDDEGDTWTTNPLACGTPLGNDHQSIVAAKPRQLSTLGYENLVYYCVNRIVDSACATSLNGGLTFNPLVTVYPPGEAGPGGELVCGGLHSHPVADPEGRVYLARDYCGLPVIAVTEDDGLTWTRHVISQDASADDHEVALATDEAGNVYALWMSEGLPVLAVSTDQARTWTAPRVVSAPGVTAAEFPTIAAGAPGRVAFAYVGTEMEGGYEKHPVEMECTTPYGGLCVPKEGGWEGATWNAYVAAIPDVFASGPVILTATVNDPADPVARGTCGRTRCSGIGDFIDIVIDAGGRPWAALVDVCTGKCATTSGTENDEPIGFVGTLVSGPALRGDLMALPRL